ncbi:ORF22 [Spodoptera eridania nucleopolyhedrovirus]|uniref:ORF22 n=1 Tax=Spodoptera eridania nucleopolyhedrovirus TaxID=2315721 RepID=A0A346TPW0_9ABAC|nr:ORF22 [Spodoptera eridania nucleopolyhedrovirus]AXU41620.1 ORF22 [Spodoptera eridania nucleopolyhedrovirus]
MHITCTPIDRACSYIKMSFNKKASIMCDVTVKTKRFFIIEVPDKKHWALRLKRPLTSCVLPYIANSNYSKWAVVYYTSREIKDINRPNIKRAICHDCREKCYFFHYFYMYIKSRKLIKNKDTTPRCSICRKLCYFELKWK